MRVRQTFIVPEINATHARDGSEITLEETELKMGLDGTLLATSAAKDPRHKDRAERTESCRAGDRRSRIVHTEADPQRTNHFHRISYLRRGLNKGDDQSPNFELCCRKSINSTVKPLTRITLPGPKLCFECEATIWRLWKLDKLLVECGNHFRVADAQRVFRCSAIRSKPMLIIGPKPHLCRQVAFRMESKRATSIHFV